MASRMGKKGTKKRQKWMQRIARKKVHVKAHSRKFPRKH